MAYPENDPSPDTISSPEEAAESEWNEPDDGESFMGFIARRRKEIAAELFLDLPIPRWDEPQIWVRYRPMTLAELRKVVSSAEPKNNQGGGKPKKSSTSEAVLMANRDLVIACCMGVYAVQDGQKFSLHPEGKDRPWTKFDPHLAEVLEVEGEFTARKVVDAIFHTEGDLVSHVDQLAAWTGFTRNETPDELEGE